MVARIRPVHLRREVEGVPLRECILGHICGRRAFAGVPCVLQEYAETQMVAKIAPVHLRRGKEGAPRREGVLGHIRCSMTSAGVPGLLQECTETQVFARITPVHLRREAVQEEVERSTAKAGGGRTVAKVRTHRGEWRHSGGKKDLSGREERPRRAGNLRGWRS